MVAHFFGRRSPTPTTLGVERSSSTFSEQDHVANQIKCSSMVANILPADPNSPLSPCPWGWGQNVKIQLFQNMVLLHIKLELIRWRAIANPHALEEI